MISFVIPTYNESGYIENTLSKIITITESCDEIIVVDGSSNDNTVELVKAFPGVKIVEVSDRGRALQMNKGAETAKNEYILFLHADTRLSKEGLIKLKNIISSGNIYWGWFRMRFDSNRVVYQFLERLAELRNDLVREPLGDHGLFVRKDIFNKIGGYPEIDIMEDVELVNKLKKLHKGIKINIPVITSPRRFENNGVFKTVLKICILRTLYYFRANSEFISKYYRDSR